MKKLFELVLVLAILAGLYYLYTQGKPEIVAEQKEKAAETSGPISITSEEISEENFTGSKPMIAGAGKLADAARAYVENTVSEFETQANTDVPPMRADFGADSPAASYSIEMEASRLEGAKTESVVISVYVYTGGAHGSSFYKTFTASRETGEILSLADIVKQNSREAFTALVKEKLISWRPELSGGTPVVFEEDVASLTFDSLENWALDAENLILYFGQYEVGPGALGAFPFPIPRRELADFLR